MKYIVTVNGKNYEVEVEKTTARVTNVSQATSAPTQTPSPAPVAAPANPAQEQNFEVSASGEVLKSPMPGVILDIKKSAGAAVKKGEVLIILEAMKMENEIVSPKDGVIAQVVTSNGASVKTNDALLVIA